MDWYFAALIVPAPFLYCEEVFGKNTEKAA